MVRGYGVEKDVRMAFGETVELAGYTFRFAGVREQVEECVVQILEVRSEGEGRLAHLLDLMYVGDWVSCYLALDDDVDPGPIPAIATLKNLLARS